MSSDLIWQLTRKHNSFLVKRNGVTFTTEPGNLTNTLSYKTSGLASKKTVNIVPSQANKAGRVGIEITTKKIKTPASKVVKSRQVSVIAKPARTTAKSVKALVQAYRPDLVNLALARAGRIHASQQPIKAKPAKTARGAAARK